MFTINATAFAVFSEIFYKAAESYFVTRCLKPKKGYIFTYLMLVITTCPFQVMAALKSFHMTVFSIAVYLVFGLMIFLLFDDKWTRKLIVYFSFCLISILSSLVYFSLAVFRGKRLYFTDDPYGIAFLIFITLAFQLAFMRMWRKKIGVISAGGRDFTLFMALPISQMIICALLHAFYTSRFFSDSSPEVHDSRTIMSLGILIFCVVLFVISDIFVYQLMLRVTRNTRLEEKIKYMDLRDKEVMQYYQTMEENIIETRKIRHDLGNALEIARCLAESNNPDSRESAEKILDSMEEELDKTRVKRYSGNNLVNVILTNKANVCRSKNIEADFHALVPEKVDSIDKFDSTRVLTNLLDNAIFAAENSPGRKFVTLNIALSDNMVRVATENPLVENVFKNDGKEHGYGLKILEDTAKKYGGTFTVTKEDGLYKTELIGYIKEQ